MNQSERPLQTRNADAGPKKWPLGGRRVEDALGWGAIFFFSSFDNHGGRGGMFTSQVKPICRKAAVERLLYCAILSLGVLHKAVACKSHECCLCADAFGSLDSEPLLNVFAVNAARLQKDHGFHVKIVLVFVMMEDICLSVEAGR